MTHPVIEQYNRARALLPTFRPFAFENWRAHYACASIILRDTTDPDFMRDFEEPLDCMVWLVVNRHRPAARALYKHVGGIDHA